MSQKKNNARPCNPEVTGRDSVEQTVARSVLSLRESLSLTQHELSDIAGISRKTLNEIEGGAKKEILLRTMMRLAVALNVSPNELLGYPSGARRRP